MEKNMIPHPLLRIQFVFNSNCCFETTELLLIKCTQIPVFLFLHNHCTATAGSGSETYDKKLQNLLMCIIKCAN